MYLIKLANSFGQLLLSLLILIQQSILIVKVSILFLNPVIESFFKLLRRPNRFYSLYSIQFGDLKLGLNIRAEACQVDDLVIRGHLVLDFLDLVCQEGSEVLVLINELCIARVHAGFLGLDVSTRLSSVLNVTLELFVEIELCRVGQGWNVLKVALLHS
jgi:hypothetical protein